jgi:hypothetical protein
MEQLAYMPKHVTIQPVLRTHRGYVSAIKLVRCLTGFSLREGKDAVDSGRVLTYTTTQTESDINRFIAEATRYGVVATMTAEPPARITMKQALDKAALFTYQGLLASVTDRDGMIEISAVSTDGLGYDGQFLADQEIDISVDGDAIVPDLDGFDDHVFRFFIPMKG